MSQALDGLEGKLNITDEILLYGIGDTKDEARHDHDLKLEALLPRCREWNCPQEEQVDTADY